MFTRFPEGARKSDVRCSRFCVTLLMESGFAKYLRVNLSEFVCNGFRWQPLAEVSCYGSGGSRSTEMEADIGRLCRVQARYNPQARTIDGAHYQTRRTGFATRAAGLTNGPVATGVMELTAFIEGRFRFPQTGYWPKPFRISIALSSVPQPLWYRCRNSLTRARRGSSGQPYHLERTLIYCSSTHQPQIADSPRAVGVSALLQLAGVGAIPRLIRRRRTALPVGLPHTQASKMLTCHGLGVGLASLQPQENFGEPSDVRNCWPVSQGPGIAAAPW